MANFDYSVGVVAANLPFTAGGTLYALDLTTSDATIALPTGAYQMLNNGSVLAAFRFGATASIPTTGSSVTDAFVCPGGAVATFTVDTDGVVLHGLTASSTATAYIMRVTR